MHNGQAHIFHKLDHVGKLAPYFWPFKLYGMNLEAEKKDASYEYAEKLMRAQRVSP